MIALSIYFFILQIINHQFVSLNQKPSLQCIGIEVITFNFLQINRSRHTLTLPVINNKTKTSGKNKSFLRTFKYFWRIYGIQPHMIIGHFCYNFLTALVCLPQTGNCLNKSAMTYAINSSEKNSHYKECSRCFSKPSDPNTVFVYPFFYCSI